MKKLKTQNLKDLFSGEIILQGMPELAYIFDKEGRLLLWNKNVEMILGYSEDELYNKYISDFQDIKDFKNEDIIQNKKLEYIVSGKGERTLVFLHGALVKLDMWFYPITKLEDKFRIIAPLFPLQMMSAQEAADFVRSILEKAVVVKWEIGGGRELPQEGQE